MAQLKDTIIVGDLSVSGSSTIENNLTVKGQITGSFDTASLETVIKATLLRAHPVGSYYWTNSSEDPKDTFGGTWERVKDKFIYALGDTGKAGDTGGSTTHTIGTTNLPPHTHDLSSHKHSFSGTTSNTMNRDKPQEAKKNTDSAGSHGHSIVTFTGGSRFSVSNTYAPNSDSGNVGPYGCVLTSGYDGDFSPYKNFTSAPPSSQDSRAGYSYYINNGGRRNNSRKRSIIEEIGSHEHDMQHVHTYSGTTGTPSNNSSGDGGFANTPLDTMPPYEKAYCWKRTA